MVEANCHTCLVALVVKHQARRKLETKFEGG